MYTASNPILPGFRPDPSACRVGDDFYIVTSSNLSQQGQLSKEGLALSTEISGGFTGCLIGLYTTANGKTSENYADFSCFVYEK